MRFEAFVSDDKFNLPRVAFALSVVVVLPRRGKLQVPMKRAIVSILRRETLLDRAWSKGKWCDFAFNDICGLYIRVKALLFMM